MMAACLQKRCRMNEPKVVIVGGGFAGLLAARSYAACGLVGCP
jgi:NADPH-dependent 2,4-dienoyl-CoA reductase/sulfur reductase-like enzyme